MDKVIKTEETMAKTIELTITTGDHDFISAGKVRSNHVVEISLNREEKYTAKKKLLNVKEQSKGSDFCL